MNLGGYTATGPREANEDNYYAVDFSDVRSFTNGVTSFIMVSDGMGGYQGGDVASGLAVASAESYIGQLLEMAEGNKIELDAEYALNEISQNAHEAILAEASERGGASMGATFVGAFLSPTHAWIGHVGDSRAYLVRDGEAMQITEDHSHVGRMLSRGLITEEEAQNHPDRNRIERALGFSDATPEMNEIDLGQGDALLLCSDGVYTVLDSKVIGEYVASSRNAEGAATQVVKSALNRGTDDNSTAVVALNMRERQTRATAGKRKRQPTMRTSVGKSELRTATGRFRASEYQRGKRPGTRQLSSGKRPAWAVAIPIAVVVVLAIAIAILFFSTGGSGGGGEADQPGQPTLGAGQEQVQGQNQPAEPSASGAASAQPSGALSTFTVADGAVLKFVGASGVAGKFTEDDSPFLVANDPMVKSGSSVEAEIGASSFGVEGRSYRALDSSYRAALLNDAKSYKQQGAPAANSKLAQVMDSGTYLALLEALSSADETEPSLAIGKLIVDEDLLSQQQ